VVKSGKWEPLETVTPGAAVAGAAKPDMAKSDGAKK
jgi:hypothetical protein